MVSISTAVRRLSGLVSSPQNRSKQHGPHTADCRPLPAAGAGAPLLPPAAAAPAPRPDDDPRVGLGARGAGGATHLGPGTGAVPHPETEAGMDRGAVPQVGHI